MPEIHLQGEGNREHFNESTDPETKRGFSFLHLATIFCIYFLRFWWKNTAFVAWELGLDHNAPHLRCVTTDSFTLPRHEVKPGFVTFRPAFLMSVCICLMSHLHKRDLGRNRMGKELRNIINHGNKLMNTGPLIEDHYCFLLKPKNMGGFLFVCLFVLH